MTLATRCAFHPEVETALTCTRCEQPACPDCLTPAAVGMHCDGCTKGRPAAGASGSTAYKVRSAVVGVDEYGRMRRPAPMFYAVVGLFLLCCIGAWLVEPSTPGAETTSARIAALSIVLSGVLVGLVLHEWAHAIVAYLGGDRSVAEKGYLTLDIRHYSQPLLSIGMPVLFLLMGGLPLPGGAVWINHGRIRSKWWDSAISLAGPGINLLGALILYGLLAAGVCGDHYVLRGALSFLAFIELGIVILNLLPLPGLDGYNALEVHLPEDLRRMLAPLRQFTFIFLLVFVTSPASDFIWHWAIHIEEWLHVDGWFGSYGERLSNPRVTD